MNYKKAVTKYKHCFIDRKGILLGMSKDMDLEEGSVLWDVPIQMYDEPVLGKIMTFSTKDRGRMINAMEKSVLENKEGFVGDYWKIVADFILALYGLSLHDLAKKLVPVFGNYSQKAIYNKLENLKKSKNSWTDEKVEWVKRICLYAGISESVLETGKGSFYVVRDAESLINKYTMEAVDEYCKVHDFVDIQKMLCNILGVTMEQIIEIPLRIAIEKKSLDKSVYKFIANCE